MRERRGAKPGNGRYKLFSANHFRSSTRNSAFNSCSCATISAQGLPIGIVPLWVRY
jgi:hypothetical protein